MSKYLYILDNGHGNDTYIKGLNPYRKSKIFGDGTQFHEYEFTRNVVKYLSFMLRQNKIDCVTLVPEENDIPIMRGRAVRADKFSEKRDSIVISIHSNWYEDDSVNGFETHYISEAGKKIAEVIQKHIGELGKNRGIKKSRFGMLRGPKSISVMSENGFYSNEKECKKLMSSDFQYEIAYAHYKAIKELEGG